MVDLPRRGDVHQVVGLHLDFVSRRQKGVEAHDEVGVTLKELGHSTDHTRRVNTLRLKLFHDIQKVIVNLWLTSKLQLHLVQVGQGVLHLESLELLLAGCRGSGVGWVTVTLDQRRAVWLYSRVVVMGAAVGSRVWSMAMTSRALSHSRNLVALGYRILEARGGLHVVSHSLVHRRRWSQNPVLEAFGASWKSALLCRKACVLII